MGVWRSGVGIDRHVLGRRGKRDESLDGTIKSETGGRAALKNVKVKVGEVKRKSRMAKITNAAAAAATMGSRETMFRCAGPGEQAGLRDQATGRLPLSGIGSRASSNLLQSRSSNSMFPSSMRRSENRSRPSGQTLHRIAGLGNDVLQRHAPSQARISGLRRFRSCFFSASTKSISLCLALSLPPRLPIEAQVTAAKCPSHAYRKIMYRTILVNTRVFSSHTRPLGKIPSRTRHMAPLRLSLSNSPISCIYMCPAFSTSATHRPSSNKPLPLPPYTVKLATNQNPTSRD
ncbi:hypothetical protein LIA77_05403 [Sarocladium implicatum]|nr:hypothetical protein LIA77_05403 [Sarocladium implicatum]